MLNGRTAVSLLLTFAGAGAIGLVPYTRWTYERDRSELLRAREPIAKSQVGTLPEPTIRFTVPDDRQWRGFVRHLGRPAFLLVVDSESGTVPPLSTPVTNENLRVQGARNDRPLIITATGLRPFGYAETNQSAAFKFDAATGDVVQVSVRGTTAPIPNDAFLMVFPLWNGLELWHWGDSLSMGQGLFDFFLAPVLIFGGAAVIFVAIIVGLAPLKPTR